MGGRKTFHGNQKRFRSPWDGILTSGPQGLQYAITGQRFSRLRSPVVTEFVKEKYQHFNPVTAFVPVHP